MTHERCASRLRRNASATSSAVHFGTVPSGSPVNGAYDVVAARLGPANATRRASRCKLSGAAIGGRASTSAPVGTAESVCGVSIDDVTVPPLARCSGVDDDINALELFQVRVTGLRERPAQRAEQV